MLMASYTVLCPNTVANSGALYRARGPSDGYPVPRNDGHSPLDPGEFYRRRLWYEVERQRGICERA